MDVNNLLSRALGNVLDSLGKTVLGDLGGKYNFNHGWTPLNVRTVWVDTSYNELMAIAQNVPHLNISITRGAEMFSLMRIKHVDKNGSDIKNSEVLEFLKKPMLLRTLEQWLYDYYVYNAIYNNVMFFPLRGLPSMMPAAINILPSGLMKVELTGKYYRQNKIEGIIEYWNMLGDPQNFRPDEIVHITEGISMNGVIGESKIPALQLPLSNIIASLKSENIITTERGMIGFLRTDSKDEAGPLPLNKTMKQTIKETYKSENSLDSRTSHVGVFSGKTEWVPMTFNMAELGLREGNEEHFCTILGAYGQPREMFPSATGATYENQREARKSYINDTLLPIGQKLMTKLGMDVFKFTDGSMLVPDFSWLPIMQEDKVKEGQARQQLVMAMSQMYKDGIISAETYAEECEVDMTGEGVPLAPAVAPAAANPQGNAAPPTK